MRLSDGLGRSFSYLRMSVTDMCNFRCQYCLPDGYVKACNDSFLSVGEIARLARAMAGLGIWKIRLTGGEPATRKDLSEIIARLSEICGIRKIAATTNGYNLAANAAEWRTAGLSTINVSVDSLRPERFLRITGHDRLRRVLEGISAARKVGLSVKINTVILKGINDDETDDLISWAQSEDLALRFIELMQTGDNTEYFRRHHLSSDFLRTKLAASGWLETRRHEGDGPAIRYSHPGHGGNVGIIAPYSKDFCSSCNRLRVTATGDLRLCLFGESSYPLRNLLQSDTQIEELQEKICDLLAIKKPSHYLQDGMTGLTRHLASLGG